MTPELARIGSEYLTAIVRFDPGCRNLLPWLSYEGDARWHFLPTTNGRSEHSQTTGELIRYTEGINRLMDSVTRQGQFT